MSQMRKKVKGKVFNMLADTTYLITFYLLLSLPYTFLNNFLKKLIKTNPS